MRLTFHCFGQHAVQNHRDFHYLFLEQFFFYFLFLSFILRFALHSFFTAHHGDAYWIQYPKTAFVSVRPCYTYTDYINYFLSCWTPLILLSYVYLRALSNEVWDVIICVGKQWTPHTIRTLIEYRVRGIWLQTQTGCFRRFITSFCFSCNFSFLIQFTMPE